MGPLDVAATALRSRRAAVPMSQELLAERSGVSVRTIRGLENGSIRSPRRATLIAVVDQLGLDGPERAWLLDAWQIARVGPLRLSELLAGDDVAFDLAQELEGQPDLVRDVAKMCDTEIDARGLLAEVTVTRTFQALVDEVDRIIWIQNFDPACVDVGDIRVTRLRNCSAGRTALVSESVVGHEVLLDSPLRRGELAMITYGVDFRDAYRTDAPPPAPETESLTGTARSGVVIHVEQVRFTPPTLPAAVWQVSQRSIPAQDPPLRTLELSSAAMVQIVVEHPGPGAVGIRWSWG